MRGTSWPTDNEFIRVNAAIENARSQHREIKSEFVWALIWQESKYDPLALGSKGEVGLGQLMPATAKALGVRDRTDIDESVTAVVTHLAFLLKKYKQKEALALAAYNGGEAYVDRCKCVPPASREYVARILENQAFATKIVSYVKNTTIPMAAQAADVSKLEAQLQDAQKRRDSSNDGERITRLDAEVEQLRSALRGAMADADKLRLEKESLQKQLVGQNDSNHAVATATKSLAAAMDDVERHAKSAKPAETASSSDLSKLQEQIATLQAEIAARDSIEHSQRMEASELVARIQRLNALYGDPERFPRLTGAVTSNSQQPLIAIVTMTEDAGTRNIDQDLSASLQDRLLRNQFKVSEELQSAEFFAHGIEPLLTGEGKSLKKLKSHLSSRWDYFVVVKLSRRISRNTTFDTFACSATADTHIYDNRGDLLTSRSFSGVGAGITEDEARRAASTLMGKDVGEYVIGAVGPIRNSEQKL